MILYVEAHCYWAEQFLTILSQMSIKSLWTELLLIILQRREMVSFDLWVWIKGNNF